MYYDDEKLDRWTKIYIFVFKIIILLNTLIYLPYISIICIFYLCRVKASPRHNVLTFLPSFTWVFSSLNFFVIITDRLCFVRFMILVLILLFLHIYIFFLLFLSVRVEHSRRSCITLLTSVRILSSTIVDTEP